MNRGVSMPSEVSARISPLTFMLPSSVAIAVPERPATMIAVMSGDSSRSTTATTIFPEQLAVGARYHQAGLNHDRRADEQSDHAHQGHGLHAREQDLAPASRPARCAPPLGRAWPARSAPGPACRTRRKRRAPGDRAAADRAQEPRAPLVFGARVVGQRRAPRRQRVLAGHRRIRLSTSRRGLVAARALRRYSNT